MTKYIGNMNEFSWEYTWNLIKIKFQISDEEAKEIADEILHGMESDVEVTEKMVEKFHEYMTTKSDEHLRDERYWYVFDEFTKWLDDMEENDG